MKQLFLCILCLFSLAKGFSQEAAYQIQVTIDGYSEKELYLGHHYGDKQLVKDTALVDEQGTFLFQGTEALDPGMYLIILAPDNKYFQILVPEEDQEFQVNIKMESLGEQPEYIGSEENSLFKDYVEFLAEARGEANELSTQLKAAENESEKSKLQNALQNINQRVEQKQQDILQEAPNSFTALIIKANLPIKVPDYEGTPEEIQQQKLYYYRNHFFDHLDLADPRMIRTSFFFSKVTEYVEKLHYQIPDSLIIALDNVLEPMKSTEDNFRYFLAHYLTKYANSKIVGMDAVYVHLALNYYGKGLATWLNEEELQPILDGAKDMEPLLIGKQAPDITMQKQDGSKVSLYQVESPFTIVYFWAYDCGACKKATPHMRDFYEQFKDRGVKIFGVCSSSKGDDLAPCWDYIQEKNIADWQHHIDPIGWSKVYYKVKSTPQMYILDKDKKIIMKQVGAEQLVEVMERLINQKSER